ncbi:hypothetical protein ACHAQH_001268 [Verticillium albo-atrum]
MVAAIPRYRRIGDEPLYCEADPAEVLYKGSDDEDYPHPSFRKYKYEAAAVKFLEGKKPFILSATLRGPFDHTSGWTNPWRSKGRSTRRSTSSRTPSSGATDYGISQSAAKLRSIRHSIEDSFTKKATALASSSCHLPSPESLDRAIQHPYLDDDELVKLESWRSRVEPAKPSIDKFWAPFQPISNSTPTRKRRAQDSGWLKTTTLKRRRTYGEFNDLDDLDTASILAQGFGMSQNTTVPVLPPPEPEAEVEDELNINVKHKETPSVICDVMVEFSIAGTEQRLADEDEEGDATPVALRHIEIPVAEQAQTQQAFTTLANEPEQISDDIADDASFNSSDSESEAAVSVDEIIPSSQPAFDSSTLVEPTVIKSVKGSPDADKHIGQMVEEDETLSIEEALSNECMEYDANPEKVGDADRSPVVQEISNPVTHPAVQAESSAGDYPTAAKSLTEGDVATQLEVKNCLTTTHQGLPTAELPSAGVERIGDASPDDASSECALSAVPSFVSQDGMTDDEIVGRANSGEDRGSPDDDVIAPSQQSPWKQGCLTPMKTLAKHNPLESSAARPLSHDVCALQQASQQTPWKTDEAPVRPNLVGTNSNTADPEMASKNLLSTPYSGLKQMRQVAMSALTTASFSIMGSFTREAQHKGQEACSTASGDTDSLHTALSTPTQREIEPPQPTPVFTLKPFADFRSPEQPARRKQRSARISGGHLPSTQSILLDANANPWGSSPRSNKRVSWGILPNENAGGSKRADETPIRARSAASPPPEQALDDLPTSEIDHFHNHFSAIKQTVKGHRHRILPTASQQVLRSPSPTAMADAFVAADELVKGSGASTTSSNAAEQGVVEAAGLVEDNGSDSGDDVADVLMNLDSFIDAMDVEADVKQARAENKPVLEKSHNPFVFAGDFDAGVWDV